MDLRNVDIQDAPGGAIVPVKAVPAGSRDRVVGPLGEALKIATAAAPEKGKANVAIAKTLAAALGVSAKTVTLIAGPTSPRKQFQVAGLSAKAIRDRLAAR